VRQLLFMERATMLLQKPFNQTQLSQMLAAAFEDCSADAMIIR
jgi:hypothetical protein